MNLHQAILIGNGTMGQRHRIRFESAGVRFLKVLDKDADTWLFENFDNWCKSGECLQTEEGVPGEIRLDFAVVASPATTHYKYVRFFLERKIPVLVEKPLATSGKQAMELVDLALANNTLLFVAQSECYNPLFLNFRKHLLIDLKKAVEANRKAAGGDGVREPLNVKLEFRREHGFSERCRDVDVSLDLLVHDVSLFLNLFRADDVIAVNEQPDSGCNSEDRIQLTLKVSSGEFAGVIARFYANRSSDHDRRTVSVEFGRNGSMSGFDYSVSLVLYAENGNVAHVPDSLDNEHKFFLKLLAGSCCDWAHRALLNAAQTVAVISK